MAFHVGQLVECVDDKPRGGFGDELYPKRGCIYTVRETGLRDSDDTTDCLLLDEIRNTPRHYLRVGLSEKRFGYYRFRPLSDARLAVFRSLLAPSPKQPVGEEA